MVPMDKERLAGTIMRLAEAVRSRGDNVGEAMARELESMANALLSGPGSGASVEFGDEEGYYVGNEGPSLGFRSGDDNSIEVLVQEEDGSVFLSVGWNVATIVTKDNSVISVEGNFGEILRELETAVSGE